ncbi:MAG: hypothetical protein HYW50_04810 [Candidatus Diapherotrites archaeon]|nr:hypothetical protein [Candidatus Diapherotrites archaeon]
MPFGHLKETIVRHPNALPEEIVQILKYGGFYTTARSVYETMHHLKLIGKNIRRLPREGVGFTRIDVKTGEPINKFGKAAKFWHQNPLASAKDVSKKFGISPKTTNSIRNRVLGRPDATRHRIAGSSFSPIDVNTGEPTHKYHQIQKMIVKHPELGNAIIAKKLHTTQNIVGHVKMRLKRKGFKFPDLRQQPKKR